MSRKAENTGFHCLQCGVEVVPVTNGSYRNHCPICLYSRHVDVMPGDRKNKCGGLMRPVGVRYHTKKGYQIVHRCVKCSAEQVTRAAQDTEQPDDLERLIQLMEPV
jgi:hypothetical protein